MDEYDRKFAEMQKYIPFLEAMIERLQNVKDKSREIQLQKMQSLHGILSNSKRKLKIETLQRCEDVLQKLHNKVEKGNAPGLHFPNKRGEGNSAQAVTAFEDTSVDHCRLTPKSVAIEETKDGKDIDETPASPSPPVSPDSGSQTEPIIIPTERSVDFIDDKSDSKPASPDQVDRLPTKLPIIIPTERTSDITVSPLSSKHGLCKNVDDVSFSEWDMLEECEKQNGRKKGRWQPIGSSAHDVSSSKPMGSNVSQKVNDGRSHVPVTSRHIPTVPVPSLGSSRRLTSVLEKNRLSALSLDIGTDPRSDSPVNSSDVRLKSPDSELLFPKHKSTSPRLKDAHAASKSTSKPPAPLLLSPPPVSEPPLSMEDLAELLNEENDGKSEKKNERSGDEATKFKKDAVKQEPSASPTSSKDAKASKPFLLTQADIDRESERRWEEIDKHIVKLTSRKCLPTIASGSKVEPVKSNEIKGPPTQPGSSTENRPPSSSPNPKPEPRYADNYERHTRTQRDAHRHENVKDKLNANLHCRLPEEDLASPITVHHGSSNKSDDRNVPLYQRRQASLGPEMVPPRVDTDFRVDGADYFNRPVPNSGHWPSLHPPVNTNEFCNNQWPPPAGFNGMPTPPVPPVPYQHPMGMHQEMWNGPPAGNAIHMDPHQINDPQHRPNPFPGNINTGIRPLITPTARPQDISHTPRPDNIRDDIPNVNVNVVMQPLRSPTNYPVAPSYRNFQGENRPYEPSFDRGMEYPHVRPTWDAQAGRMNEVPYRGEGEMHSGIIGTEGPVGNANTYPRPSTPCTWNRDRDRCNRGRGREPYYSDRGRGEARGNFNRDVRRPEWPRDGHAEWENCNRFNRDNRNLSERDPRVRMEHNIVITTQNQPRENSSGSARDPRLAKDKHVTPVKNKEAVYTERDARKRPPPLLPSPRKVKDKPKSPKSSESQRRSDPENGSKHAQEKTQKDKMQSPLESLYGVIDTKAKTAQGYCLQNFKIPKIKRTEPSQSPTPSNVSEEAKPVDGKGEREDRPNATEKGLEEKPNKDEIVSPHREKHAVEKEDMTEEVSSSSDGNIITENWSGTDDASAKKEGSVEANTSSECVEDSEKGDLKIGEADSIMIGSPKPSDNPEKSKKEDVDLVEIPKSKDEVTQEWIEALIRKSFEFGEGKKIVEQAKLLQKLGEALQAKKLKKIKKIIASETESSSSERDEDLESKKIRARKKRRVIVSDSSDEESLAERLGTFVGTTATTSKEQQEETSTDDNNKECKKEAEETLTPDVAAPSKLDDTQEAPIAYQESDDSVQKDEPQKENVSIETSEKVQESDTMTSKCTTVKNGEEQDDKEALSRTPKAKSRRRNSLEMLQEDIREMFICEGVVTATGHRMCRIQKENQQSVPATTSAQSSPTVNKKDEASSKRDKETNSEVDESVALLTKQKKTLRSRSTDETSKPKSKTRYKVQRITRHRSKQFVPSSDSEEDQPLALRTEIAQNSSSISNQDDETQRSEDQPEILRRSKRVINKEIVKEPRVLVEKTDISKLECSKVMFDSSSDESFGIDVSELAAAVDISLHPEKQTEPEASGDAEASKKKAEQDIAKKPLSRKRGNDSVPEDKDEDVVSDEESITSDISLSSSVASAKKSGVGRTRSEVGNSEELLSNILVGLVPTKADTEKCSVSTADKGSDADVDDDANDQTLCGQGPRKGYTKKKKKKCNWQLGILAKKKKKKTLTSPSPKLDSDQLNTSTETVSSTKTDSSFSLQDKINDEANGASLEDKSELLAKNRKEDVTTDSGKTSSEACDTAPKTAEPTDPIVLQHTPSTLDEVSSNRPDTSEKCMEEKESTKNTEVKQLNAVNSLKKSNENKKVQYDDLMEKAFRSLDIKSLVDYVWTGQERYKCLLCFFTGKNIVHHYKLNHPGKEILISRLRAEDAQKAIQQADQCEKDDTSQDSVSEQSRKFSCRFCYFTIEGAANVGMEAFYEHCTTHTGEYRFRCNSCPYQAVAKSSMRTHFYKVCRKVNDIFYEATSEDPIPKENYIYGFICSNCNYVQLKRSNIQQHLDLWHSADPSVKIVKINMSVATVKGDAPSTAEETVKEESSEIAPEKTEIISEKSETPVTIYVQNDNKGEETILAETGAKSQKKESNCPKTNEGQHKPEPSQGETETPLTAGNLSVFVCPPELEKKEVEIQLERKRKMQEVIKNIGIKLNKDGIKKISIIDKLKDKMKTNLQAGVNSENNDDSLADDSTKNIASIVASTPTSAQSNAMELCETNCNASFADDTATNSSSCQQEASTADATATSPARNSEQSTETTAQASTEVDKLDTKMRDPLATVTDEKKSYESEVETSDNENARAPIYESDSSSEQSDSEPPADVSMLLQETSSINSSSKDGMLTTIQRLAAQLQAAKPLEACNSESSAKAQHGAEKPSASVIPKPPNVVPIVSMRHFVGKLDKRYPRLAAETHDDSYPPKNFIRLRRLSGDMLSIPMPTDVQEDFALTKLDGNNVNVANKTESCLQTDVDEECSFLKIENVVSLAPRSENDGAESPIINDIRKAVETSPIKSKGVSLLKKSNTPLILKRLNTVALTHPLPKTVPTGQPATSDALKIISVKNLPPTSSPMSTTQLSTSYVPIAPKSKLIQLDSNKLSYPLSVNKSSVITPVTTRPVTVAGSTTQSNVNYKIVKVVRPSTILKPKEPAAHVTASKSKTSEVYSAMIKPSKLCHFYKCMARDCPFTTDTVVSYSQHYNQHTNEIDKRRVTPPYDYQRCAYCYQVTDDWSEMKSHLEEKHEHCRYQCSYCFYRAIAPSYVQIHQILSHPGHHGILLGKVLKEVPLAEELNRHDYVHPYVCQHDCGKFFYVPEAFAAHLKTKHPTSVFKCHVCCVSHSKIEQLISHYKTHSFYKYQCLYCPNGSETFNEMHCHLSTFHSNRIPQILERSLPPQPMRNKDVIEQLIIRKLDENVKNFDEIIDVDGGTRGEDFSKDVIGISSSPLPSLEYSQLPNEITVLDSDQHEVLNTPIQGLLIPIGNANALNLSSGNTTPSQPDKLSLIKSVDDIAAQPKTTGNLTDVADILIASATNKSSLELNSSDVPCKKTVSLLSGKKITGRESGQTSRHIHNETELQLSSYASNQSIDSLQVSGALDCSDEFININLLDNPDFLKTGRCNDTSFVTNASTVNESKAEDSDIEILDNIDSTADEDARSTSKISNSDEKSKINTTALSIATQNSDKNDQQTPSAKAENTSTADDTNENPSNTTTKSDKPLTLEDIKDTGFSGTMLYICGYESCNFSAQTAILLRTHMKECPLRTSNKSQNCVHCGKRFVKIGCLLEHLKLHGVKRFGCSLCKMRCPVAYQAMVHMKTKHKFTNNKLVPADPTNPSADGLFIVQPVNPIIERRGKKRKSIKSGDKDSERTVDVEKLSFNPDEIESLPRQAIYNREVHCAVCPYTTKVRTNIIRHLQLHAKDETVPETGPVNPVPCLDKKERMFDKMVNLASSSHQNGRMGGKPKEAPKDNDDEFIPKFVPEHKRYVCGVAECNYLTVDEAMLRYHLKALHSEEPYFRCPHCPPPQPGQESINVAIDKMGIHLKMHDTRLYKCSHCNHHHYHRHIVERHLTDKHPEKRPFVKVIRELESTENTQQPPQEEIEEDVPDPDGNHWKCNICEYKCVYKAEMISHASTAHDEKCQFKCTICTFKTSGKIMFEQHMSSKHFHDKHIDYIMIYQRIKGVNKKNTETVEQVGQEEPFDTTPLWRRDMPRIRHIRGILLEEEDDASLTDSSLKTTKRKSDAEAISSKPAKIKPGKSASLDENKQSKEKSKRSLSCEKIPNEMEQPSDVVETNKDARVEGIEAGDLQDSDVGRFGPYGKPDGNMYVCTLCTQFRTKYKHDMRDHLYRELNYARWHCKECGYLSVNRNALLKHFGKHHQGGRPDHEPLSPDDTIENWVRTLLKNQTCIMRGLSPKQTTGILVAPALNKNTSVPLTPTDNVKSSTAASNDIANKTVKPINPQQTVSNIQDSTVKSAETNVNGTDDDSRDALVIDIKEDSPAKAEKSESVSQVEKEPEQAKPLTCKHCKMIFTRWRGFKLHVQLTHLKRLGFLCPYCDRSTNSESLMRQHIRSKHAGCPEKIVQNPAAGGPELTNDFWEKEYGIVCPQKSPKKRKRKLSTDDFTGDNDGNEPTEAQEKCALCGFIAMGLVGLKAHMRIHTVKNSLKCANCPFVAGVKSELWEHWEDNHPFVPFKLEESAATGSTTESASNQRESKRLTVPYSDDIEEEEIIPVPGSKDELIYCCFYCSLRSRSLEALRKHWSIVHKDSKLSNDPSKSKTSLPFRYKEMRMSLPSPPKQPKKMPYTKSETESPYELYLQQSQSDVSAQATDASGASQEGWECQWCNELCDTESKMKTHQNMFHSHLPLNFKRKGSNEPPKGYLCPDCPFTTTFINSMKSHVTKHINLFKCKYCSKTFSTPTHVSSHNAEEHPDLEFKIESIQNYDLLIENMMAKVKWCISEDGPSNSLERAPTITIEPTKNHAVAKKSTAKPTIRVQSIPCKVKAVARKSTNPFSRYIAKASYKENENDKSNQKIVSSKQFSAYGAPKTPVNLAKLNTYMVVGGHRMKVNCTTLAQLININPQVVLTDLKHDIKNLTVFSKLK